MAQSAPAKSKWGKPIRCDHRALEQRYTQWGVVYPPYLRRYDRAQRQEIHDVARMPKATERAVAKAS